MNVPDLDALCINLVNHATANIRIAALSLLISSFKTTAPLPSNVLICLRQCIPNFHQEIDPRTRNEFIALTKHLCSRLSSAEKQLSRFFAATSKSSNDIVGPDENLMDHFHMIRWYQHFLWRELRPTASYQSHITALKIVPLIFGDSALSEFYILDRQYPADGERRESMSREKYILAYLRPLLDLLADPFDDIRLSASEVLYLLYPSIICSERTGNIGPSRVSLLSETLQIKLVHQVEIALARAEESVRRSGRADHADSLGRLYNFYFGLNRIDSFATISKDKNPFHTLLCKLEKSLQATGQDLPSDFLSFPLHGPLIRLRWVHQF
jgi:hypothetical protein